MLPSLALLVQLAAASPASALYDGYILIQPIQVCNDDGTNCGPVTYYAQTTRIIYAQASVLPLFLPTTMLLSTNDNTTSEGIGDIGGPFGGTTIQAYFVSNLVENPPGGVLYGEGYIDDNGLVVDGNAVLGFSAAGRIDTFAHELGHNLGLGHGTFGAGGASNLMTMGSVRSVPSNNGDINPNGLMLDQLNSDQIDEIRASAFVLTAVDCDGDGNVNVITKTYGEVCLNMNGLGGDDILTLTGGAVLQTLSGGAGNDIISILAGGVGGDVLGDAGNDTINLAPGAFVMGNVDGGADNDTITIAGDPVNVYGGIGNDTITLNTGAVVTQSVFGDDGDGNEANGDGNDIIVMNDGSVGVNVDGEGGNDQISILGGTIGGSVLGGGGMDTIAVSGGAITGGVEGEDGADQITISGGTIGTDVLGGAGIDSITLSGSGTITGDINGGGDGDTISIQGGSVTNVLGDTGADSITLLAGTVTGNIDGGGDGDTISIQGGSVANVLGGAGVDSITLLAGTISGNIDGGSEGDTISIQGGSVANVLGNTGADTITLVTGTVTGDINGGGDGDTITVQGGSVVNVLGDTGADTITLLAGTISGNIDGGDQGDTISIQGGSVASVLGGAGDDTATWNGGTIATKVDMGTGTDTLDIFGTNAGGTALQAGLLELNGGDDASSLDGQIDTLNLRGVAEVLTDLKNWEFINLLNNSVGDLGSASRTIVTEQFFVEEGSTLVAKSPAGSQVYTIDGSLLNYGIVAMQHQAATYDELGVTGTYTGGGAAGAQFSIDTFLGVYGSPSDLMRVGTATAGVTGIDVYDTNPGPGVYNPLGIEVVRVESLVGGQTAPEHFSLLGGPIQKDLWIWDLGLDDTRSNPGRATADVHVLYSRPTDIVQFTPYFGTGALTAFHASLEPWLDRQQTLTETLATPDLRAHHLDLWAAPFGARRLEDDVSELTYFGKTFTSSMNYDQVTYGVQGGADFIARGNGMSAFMAGIFGGYLNSSMSPDTVPVSGKYEGGTVGAYAVSKLGGLVISAVFNADLLDFSWKAPTLGLTAESSVNTYGGRVEAAFKTRGPAWLEPYANVTYAKSNWDPFTVLATTFAIDDNESVLGRAGLRVGADVHGSQTMFKVFAGLGVAHEFIESTNADIISGGFTLPLSHGIESTSVEVQGGMKLTGMDNGLSLAVTSSGTFSKDVQQYGVKATVNARF